ncbi:hypothetical protein CC78DRAFT_534368 [Lojkania enalia]|uniref:Uncharacterized protein n=1 Tax=Lojkania enalia TaxID=147567 RepID=A0A9P4K706_9PLEO|nr:hypothetical protein CC78DRAFT_534368 [Didymosphaeria enalia]
MTSPVRGRSGQSQGPQQDGESATPPPTGDERSPHEQYLEDENEAESDDEDGRIRNQRPAKRARRVGDIAKDYPRAFPALDTPEYKHNLEHSRLHQLPAELLLHIRDVTYEYPDAIFAMRLVARDFYPIFEPPFIIGLEERNSFKAGLRRDAISWHSRWERYKGLPNLSIATCSACKSRHPKSKFPAKELEKAPEERVCIGAEKFIQLCEHHTFSLNDIRDAGENVVNEHPSLRRIFVVLSNENDIAASDEAPSRPFLEATIGNRVSPSSMSIARHFHLLCIPKTHHVMAHDLLGPFQPIQELLGLEVGIRELYPKDTQLFAPNQHIAQYNSPDYFFRSKLSGIGIGSHVCNGRVATHKEDDQVIFFLLRRRRSRAERQHDDITLTIYRDVVAEGGVGNPAWADKLISITADEQSEWNRKMREGVSTILYNAEGTAEWDKFEVF